MHFISHRGNVSGPVPDRENRMDYILEAMEAGFDVEIDVWIIDGHFFLGHDDPQYLIHEDFLKSHVSRLWCHAKHATSLRALLKLGMHVFSHDRDPVVLTSKGVPWAFPGQPLDDITVCVMPERVEGAYSTEELKRCGGICSDFVSKYRATLVEL